MRNNYKGKKRPRLTPGGIAVVMLVCAIFLLLLSYGVLSLVQGNETEPTEPPVTTQPEPEQPEGVLYGLTPELSLTGDLILISNTHLLSFELDPDLLVNIYSEGRQVGFGLRDVSMLLPDNVLTPLCDMFGAAKAIGGFKFVLMATYRSLEEQQALYDEIDDPARAAKPGGSEHNVGIAVDIGRTGGAMEGSSEAEWIKENAWKYGFIVRYPSDKSTVTGITYEPWHIRYVGKTHAALMTQKGYCLEEYLEYLKKQGNIKVRDNAAIPDCDIYYADTRTKTEIELPTEAIEVSGDNTGGVIFVCPADKAD